MTPRCARIDRVAGMGEVAGFELDGVGYAVLSSAQSG